MTAHPLAAAFPLLTPAQLDQISGLAENVAIEKGSVLLQEGRHPEALYMITGGVADLVKHLAETELIVAEIKAGELIGEMSFAGNFPATATVKAATDIAAIKNRQIQADDAVGARCRPGHGCLSLHCLDRVAAPAADHGTLRLPPGLTERQRARATHSTRTAPRHSPR